MYIVRKSKLNMHKSCSTKSTLSHKAAFSEGFETDGHLGNIKRPLQSLSAIFAFCFELQLRISVFFTYFFPLRYFKSRKLQSN